MGSEAPIISSKYPRACGDPAIKSSDGVICYFPKAILSLASPVFREMFELTGNQKDETLELAEPATTIELLLSYLDPTNLSRVIDPDTIETLLVTAHKYEMKGILTWFQREASIKHVDEINQTTQGAFLFTNPALVLSLAIQCNFKDIGKIALRELCGGDKKLLIDLPLTGSISGEIYRYRESRIRLYESWIKTLVELPPGHQAKRTCMTCTRNKAEWIFEMTTAIYREPRWNSFIAAYNTGDKACCYNWAVRYREDYVPTWERSALEEESKLPDWPY